MINRENLVLHVHLFNSTRPRVRVKINTLNSLDFFRSDRPVYYLSFYSNLNYIIFFRSYHQEHIFTKEGEMPMVEPCSGKGGVGFIGRGVASAMS